MPQSPRFEIEVVHADAIDFPADVLVIKYSPFSGGLDAVVGRRLVKAGNTVIRDNPPEISDFRFTESPSDFGSRWVLMIGTVSPTDLGYEEIRQLGYDMISALSKFEQPIEHIVTTAHGINTRLALDEVEAFRSLLLGFTAAVEDGLAPETLKKITVVEFVAHRAELFKDALQKFLPPTPTTTIDQVTRETAQEIASILTGSDSLDEEARKPLADESTPHIFVAMPFVDEFDDHYYLAIRPAITSNEVLCVRLDQDDVAFTGDIMEQVKERIRSAQLVVALLDRRNPNVYLEVGYAWGVGTPTILVLHEEEEAPFDVQGAKLLTYRRMHKLKDDLTKEIKRLMR